MKIASCLRFTDLPSIFSGSHVGFLDPHEKYFNVDPNTGVREKGKRGLKKRISTQLLHSNLRNQFCPFLNPLFGCNEMNFTNGSYPGTIFRFPLRVEGIESNISSVIFDDDRVKKLFQSFQSDAEISLLFLKSVESVAIYEKNGVDHAIKDIFKCEISKECCTKLRLERYYFLQECREKKKRAVDCQQVVSCSDVKISTQSQNILPELNRYIIINVLKTNSLSRILKTSMSDKDLNLLPWVGIAAKVNAPRAIEGRTFCFLPLPESEKSHLPIHVHGYFGLGDNRRSIKWPDRESQHDKSALWNRQLIEEVLPEAYMRVILEAISAHLPTEQVYNQWPKLKNLTGAWKVAARNLISKLSRKAILYTEARGGVWMAPEDVYVNTTGDELIHRVMLKKGQEYPIVKVPPKVLEGLRSGGVVLKEVTPSLIRHVVRGDTLGWLSRRDKLHLLDYVLKDKDFSDLEGVCLLPLKDKNFKPFTKKVTSLRDVVFRNNTDIPSYLFPNKDSMFCSDDCPHVLNMHDVSLNTQIRDLTTTNVVRLLKEALPVSWTSGKGWVKWTPGLEQQPQKEWLQQLWDWLRRGLIPLIDLSPLPLIQVIEFGGTIYMARLQANTLIFQTNLSTNICSFLQSIGAMVVEKRNIPDYIHKHPEISAFVHKGNAEGVMHILEAHWSVYIADHIAKGSDTLKNELATLLSEIPRSSLTTSWKNILRSMPIFNCTDGTRVSAKVCQSGILRGFFGIPVRRTKARFVLVEDDLERLAKDIGISFMPETTLLVQYMLPQIQSDFYTEVEKVQLVTWVLERPKFDRFIKNIPIIPTSDGCYSSPKMLYDPDNRLLRGLFGDSSLIPIKPFDETRSLIHLRRIGFKDESDVSAQQLFEVACEISRTTSLARSFPFLNYICRYVNTLNKKVSYRNHIDTLGAMLKKLPWVVCESQAPSWYPDTVPWYGKSRKLCKPCEVKCLEYASLIGSVVPLVDASSVPLKIRELFSWSHIDIEQIAKHLQNTIAVRHYDKNRVFRMTMSIYRYLGGLTLPRLLAFAKTMENKDWIWHGDGFTSLKRVAFSSDISLGNLAPHLYIVPECKELKMFLSKIGIRKAFLPIDYAMVLGEIKESYKGKPLNEKDMQAVQDIIRAMTRDDYSFEDDIRKHVFVPDQNCVLRPCEQLTYTSQPWLYRSHKTLARRDTSSWDGSSVDLVYAHHCITSLQAMKLRIKTLTDIRLDQCSTDRGFAVESSFGQRERLTTRLRGILAESPNECDVLKELLQNADDAGATEFHIVYDPRIHKGDRISGPSWKSIHKLPALCVYNDKPFTDTDIEGIQNVGVGGKISDRTTIGRFGIGFNVVYHLTDCPTFLTQNMSKLCVFDPHTKYVPRATASAPGKLYNIRDQRFVDSFADMTEGYLQEFDEFDFSKGTMFRFPLRSQQMKSEISDKKYSTEKVNVLLSKFEEVSRAVLLFLNNIKKLSISEVDQETKMLKVRYSVSVSLSPEGVNHRNELGRYLETNKSFTVSQIRQMNRTYTLEMSDNCKREKWLISQVVGVDRSFMEQNVDYELKPFMNKAYLPRGGAAVPLSRRLSDAKAFCFLPLQTDPTGLPVYVNGTFILDQSRQNLMKSDEGLIHPWNKLLAEHVIGPAYSYLIYAAGRLILQALEDFEKRDGQFTCSSYDRLYPTYLQNIQGIWKLIAISALRFIDRNDLEVMPVVKMIGLRAKKLGLQWFSPDAVVSNAYFDNLSDLDPEVGHYLHALPQFCNREKHSEIIRNFLRDVGFNLISCHADICRMFTSSYVATRAAFVTPKHCVTHIKLEIGHYRLPTSPITDDSFQVSKCSQRNFEVLSQGFKLLGRP